MFQCGAEQLGMVDDATRFQAYYINERLKENPNLTMILTAHSQGALKDSRVWDLIDEQYKNQIYIVTGGGAQLERFTNSAGAFNITKTGDFVSGFLGNQGPIADGIRLINGNAINEYNIELQWDHESFWRNSYDFVTLDNHLYIENYNNANVQVISEIIMHESGISNFDNGLNSTIEKLNYENN